MRIILLYLFLSLCCSFAIDAKSFKIKVKSGDYPRKDCIVYIDLSDILNNANLEPTLFDLSNKKNIDCQLIFNEDRAPLLTWIMSGETKAHSERNYLLKLKNKKRNSKNNCLIMTVVDNNQDLTLKNKNKNVLKYKYTITEPPKGVSDNFKRSGYIHPAYSPKGNILTTIQPKDHYHHYGIWNPWTRIEYDGQIYDLWNLGDKKGTVRSEKIEDVFEGNICSGFVADLGHFIFTPSGEKKIINEKWTLNSWNIENGFLWDFTSTLNPATNLPVLIKAYRYAGFGWRATEDWTKENCEMFTSEGKDRKNIDGSNARWIYVTGQCGDNGKSGLLILSHPSNQSYPEPLRIWDKKANNGRGDAFVNFAPTKNKDWNLDSGKTYKLHYRVYAYDGEMNKDKAECIWIDFAYPPKAEIIN